jgi:hypothetical protein
VCSCRKVRSIITAELIYLYFSVSVELDKERARTNELQIDLQRGKSTVKDLQGMLEDERQHARDAKLMDAALIEVRSTGTW